MLTLPIKRKWFDMICRGEKREEYREPTDYWKERLFRARGRAPENEIPDPFHLKIFPIQIRAGYRQDSPTACLMVTFNSENTVCRNGVLTRAKSISLSEF